MKPTEQQIQERANLIGSRPYHPVPDDSNSMYRTEYGISIRQELMRTAMGSLIPMYDNVESGIEVCALCASNYVDALLLEMARHELGVTE